MQKTNSRHACLHSCLAALALSIVLIILSTSLFGCRSPRRGLRAPGPITNLIKIGKGSFPKISPDGRLIAYTKESADPNDPQGFGFEIYTMKPDGSHVTCLTHDKEGVSNTRWRGQPYWHPSGNYIAFTAESKEYPRKGNGTNARPGIGRNHNVWIMTADGSRFWQMTDYPDNWGVIRPSFSHDGKTLYWCEEFMMEEYPNGEPGDRPGPHPGSYWGRENIVFRKGEELGAWRVKTADISFATGKPVISNIRHIDPPAGLTIIEGEGLMPDDEGFVYSYSSRANEGGRCFCGDIYTSDMNGKTLKNLTDTPGIHDENAEFSPDGSKIAWNHSVGYPGDKEDLYLMDANGGNNVRLTYFGDPGHPEYDANARQITESTWSPDGKFIVFGHVSDEREYGLGPHIPSDLYRLTFR